MTFLQIILIYASAVLGITMPILNLEPGIEGVRGRRANCTTNALTLPTLPSCMGNAVGGE